MKTGNITNRFFAVLFAVALGIPLLPVQVQACQRHRDAITVQIGQPSIWSLAQAHYLLANLRHENRGIKVDPLTLKPNSTNGARIEILKKMLGIEVGYNEVVGTKNQAALQRYNADFSRKQQLQTALDQKRVEREGLSAEIADLTKRIDALKLENKPENADRIKELEARKQRKTDERSALSGEITSLETELGKIAITDPNPTSSDILGTSTTPTTLPKALAENLKDIEGVELDASTQLDNYINLQYEIIAKQLTLLRDEAGPGKRLVFLELPASFYTVPGRDDEHIVHIQWNVEEYFGDKEAVQAPRRSPRKSVTLSDVMTYKASEPSSRNATATVTNQSTQDAHADGNAELQEELEDQGSSHKEINKFLETKEWKKPVRTQCQVVDIIPRQSALNVNSRYDTVSGFSLAARFLSVFGLGGKVDFQRQRELYEQFIYQDVFASGYGKGLSEFGWTFGPRPGTKRLAPGVRTTHVVLSVPDDAIAVKLKAAWTSCHREESDVTPREANNQTFTMLIPQEATDGFWVNGVSYKPVAPGKYVTVNVTGHSFSPQIGILVNGVPLRRAVSIAKSESDRIYFGNITAAADGEFEYLDSQNLVMTFKMPDTYAGTPQITFIAPEKISAINHFDRMRFNGRYQRNTTLEDLATTEPMFLDRFELAEAKIIENNPCSDQMTVRLIGKGFRPKATILVNGRPVKWEKTQINDQSLETVVQESTTSYRITFPRPAETSLVIGFEQKTGQTHEKAELPPLSLSRQTEYELVAFDGSEGTGTVRLPNLCPNETVTNADLVGTNHSITWPLVNGVRQAAVLRTSTNRTISIPFPTGIQVTGLKDNFTGGVSGPSDGGSVVTITGRFLNNVGRVLFNNKPATIMHQAPGMMVVRTPSSRPGKVLVLLEANYLHQQKRPNNLGDQSSLEKSVYEYVGKPVTAKARPPQHKP